ncbi:MAG: hypothetical protein ACRD59_18865 [Candidatus Acidiferrales bacterium]
MSRLAGMTLISVGVASIGWILSIGWYQVTRRDELDRDTMLFFAKLWIGIGAFGILMFLFFRYA